RVGVCTGRPGRGLALDYAGRVDRDGLHVFESGAVVMRGDGALVHADALSAAAIDRAVALGDEVGATVEVYTAREGFHARERDVHIAAHERLLGVAARIGPIPDGPIVRLQWVIEEARWPTLERAAADLADVDIHLGRSPKMPGMCFVAVTARGVSKASGMRVALARLGVPAERAAMVGDNLNDLPAFRAVGTAFATADGAPEAIAEAHHVVPGPAEGGVADAVETLLLRG
ncbi:MAG: HAD family phosphatase, partial [Deltaproteobacteria bacterium]